MSDNIKIFKNPAELSESLSLDFIDFVNQKEIVNIALSGGSTPKIFFESLAKHKDEVNWSKVHFYWGDERCVASDDEQSNYRMTKEALLQFIDIPEQNVHRVLGENDPAQEASRYAREIFGNLLVVNQLPRFDWVILGLGTDGHTASLFPNTLELENTQDLCVVAQHPGSGQKRISFTFPLLENAERISFLVTGESKKEVLNNIIRQDIVNEEFPASLLFSRRQDAEWWVDEAAFS